MVPSVMYYNTLYFTWHSQGIMKFLCCLVLLLKLTKASEENPCSPGWIQTFWVEMGFLLFYSKESYGWDEANAYCQEIENATLVEILTEEQLDFISMELTSLGADVNVWWSGALDTGREGNWIWISSLRPVEVFMWEDSQPNGCTGTNSQQCGPVGELCLCRVRLQLCGVLLSNLSEKMK